MNYYRNTTHLSTSFLKKVLNPDRAFPETDALEFGQMVDMLLSEYQPLLRIKFDLTTPESLGVTEEAFDLANVYLDKNKLPYNSKSRFQWELYKTLEMEGLKVKMRGKLDHWLKGYFVEDFKTGKNIPFTKSSIENLIHFLDYDMQAYNYLRLTGEKTFYLSFLCRYKMDLFQYKVSNDLIKNGRIKTEKAIKLHYERNDEKVY